MKKTNAKALTISVAVVVGIAFLTRTKSDVTPLSTSKAIKDEAPVVSINSKERPEVEAHTLAPTKKDSELPVELQEISDLQQKIQSIQQRTGFDYKKMTNKEYEDSIGLLKEYNQKMKTLLKEVQAGAQL